MSAPGTVDMDLSPVESFHTLFKNLWSMNIAFRIKLNVVDTILFRDGLPYYWIFTSDQTGEIMKKKAERMESNAEIIRCLKQKSRTYTSSKEVELRNKVAIVWYQETDKNVLSCIVDEVELKTIMNSCIQEILCIQPYIGSISFRGSGVFEHRVFTQKDGTLKHVTYEMLCEKGHTTIFTTTSDEVEKWIVTEHQHGALTSIAKQLIAHMGFMNKCKVSNLVIQCVFSEQWVPHIIACKRVAFASVPQALASKKDELIYPNGRSPLSVVSNPNSILPKSDTNNMFNRKQSTLPGATTTTSLTNNTTLTSTTNAAAHPVSATTTTTTRASLIASPAPMLPTPQLIPPAPASPVVSPSTKIRRSSVTYDTQTTYYAHYNTENERRAAALQRQSSIKAEIFLADALQEARNIANEASVSGKFNSQGSTRMMSPPRSRKASYDFDENVENKNTTECSEDGNSPAPATNLRKSFSNMGTSSTKRSFSAGKARKYPTDRRDTIQQNKRFAPEENSTSNPTSRGTSPTNANEYSPTTSSAKYTPSHRFTNHESMKRTTSPKPVKRASMMAKIPDFNTRQGIIDTTTTQDGIAEVVPRKSMLLSRALTSVPSNTTIPSITPTFTRHHTITTISNTPQPTNDVLDINNMVIPSIDPSREPSKVNYNIIDHYATVHMGGKPSTYNALQVAKSRPTIVGSNNNSSRNNSVSNSRNNSSFNLFQTINSAMDTTSDLPRRASSATTRNKRMSTMTINTTATGANPFNETFATNVTTANAIANRVFRPDSANSVSRLRKTVEKINCAEGASTGLISAIPNARRTSTANNAASGGNNTNANTFGNTAYVTSKVENTTEARQVNTSYYKQHVEQNDDENLKVLNRVFSERRPISAPNISRSHVVSSERNKQSQKDLFGDELYFTGDDKEQAALHPHSKGNIVGKIVPFTGVLCHGGYCDFKERAKNAAQNEKEIHPHIPSTHCTYKLAHKSIVLCKAETKFLGLDIDENIESLLDQIRLSNVSMEQLYTYFVRRHLNKIAQRVQDEAKRLHVANEKLDPAVQQVTDIDTVYRGLVYADALKSIHPSRFYISVPVCEMCYQIYTNLDNERDTIVLNNINQQTVALHTAEMQMEKERFSLFAKSGSGSHGRKHGTLRGVPSSSGRRKSERRRSSMLKAVKDANPHNELAPAEEDPYQVDDTVYTDAFVPHHTAQRDIYSDNHKKDNFASTLRTNVANIQFYAEQAMSMVVQNNHGDVINIHNVNNIDDGTLNNHRKQKSRSRSTSPRKGNSRPNSPTNAMKRQIVYDAANDGHIEAHVHESAVLSSKKNTTDTNTHTATSTTSANDISEHFKPMDQNNTPFAADNKLPHAQSARRKALLYRDNIPVNTKDVTIHNTTHDCGIGSKGPIVKQMVNNSIKPVATLSKWVNMLHSGTVHNLYTSLNTNAMYDTNQQWDAQGNVPYTKNTLSTDYRIQANKLRRPQSASNIPMKHQHSDSTNSDSTVYGILQPTIAQTDNIDSVNVTPNTSHTAVPHMAHTLDNSYVSGGGKVRPSSAGPIPYKSAPHNRPVRLTKEETINVLETNMASQMLHLANDFLQVNNVENRNEPQPGGFAFTAPASMENYHISIQQHEQTMNNAMDWNAESEEDFAAAYAYTSLPFMAAPYLPSRPSNNAAVADAAYTQLQIDPLTQTIIQPTLTPAQIEQKHYEQEQALLQEQINYQRRQIELHRQAEYEQLQKDRAELQQAHRERANSVFTNNTTGSNDHPNHAHPRVSFVQLNSTSGSHSNHNSPAQRRHKRHVSISEGNKNRRGSVGSVANRRNSVGSMVPHASHDRSKTNSMSHDEESCPSVATDQIAELSSLLQLQQQLNQRHEEELLRQKHNASQEAAPKSKSASFSRSGSAKKSADISAFSVESHHEYSHNGNIMDVTADIPEDNNSNTALMENYELPVPLDLLTIHASAAVPTHNTNSVHDSVTSLGFSPMSPPLFEHFQDSSIAEPAADNNDVTDEGVADSAKENAFMYAQYFQDAPMYGLDNSEDNTFQYDTQPVSQQYTSGTPFTILESIQSAPPSVDVYDGDMNSTIDPHYPTENPMVEEVPHRKEDNAIEPSTACSEVVPRTSTHTPPVIDTTNEDTPELYTDTGSSGGVNSPMPEQAPTVSEKLWQNVSMYTADYNISGINSVDITELPVEEVEVELTPVYIHDLHTCMSVKNSAFNTADNSGNTTENRPLSPFADLYIPAIPPSPHPHSPPARAHDKVMEHSEAEEARYDEDL